jgi:broad specificity phosphatase PhoE
MRLPALLAVCALALSACGSDDEPMTAAEYRAAAEKICTDSQKATDAVERPRRATPESIADYLERLRAANQRTTDRFRALEPPEKLQKAHDEVLKVNEEGAEQVRAIIERLENKDDPAEVLQSATGPLRELNARSNAAAEELGVPACVQESATPEE